ncbi:MiaB/RimO family radical SAM methylthiotransferase [Elusimicrobiota bacterium]
MKLYIKSFGCQMNVADSEEMGGILLKEGFRLVEDIEKADAVLVNTCTVRQNAENKAMSFVGELRKWKEKKPKRLIIVAGCAAENTKDWLRTRFPYVDLVVGAKSIEEFPGIIKKFVKGKTLSPSPCPLPSRERGKSRGEPHHCFVTISRGCNLKCSFCIVPAVRGRERYRSPKEILAEIKRKAAKGVREVTLLGQTVNSYRYVLGEYIKGTPRLNPLPQGGRKKEKSENEKLKVMDFADLLKEIGNINGIKWIRFMSPHPVFVTPKLIKTMAGSSKICKHIHLPMQSGSDKILKLMQRHYTREKFLEIVTRLKTAMPDISITTDIVVGFPFETETDFNDTIHMIKKCDFSAAYCFKFSARPDTIAAELEKKSMIDQKTKDKRHKKTLELCRDIASVKAPNFLGRIEEVMLDEEMSGHTDKNYIVRLTGETQNAERGDIRPVLIKSTKRRKLIGEVVA